MKINNVEYCIKNYSVDTNYSFTLTQSKNGSFIKSDRTSSEDYYRSSVTLYNTQAVLRTLIDYIEEQRKTSDTISIDFSTYNEQPFGADIDYSSAYDVVIVERGKIKQNTFKGFGLKLVLELQTPIFSGTATLPDLRYSFHSFVAGTEYTKHMSFSYDRSVLAVENNADYGTFTGTFQFDDSEMANARRFFATQRGDPFYLDSINGVDYIFSKGRNIRFPARVRMVGLSETYSSPDVWDCKIEFAEEV